MSPPNQKPKSSENSFLVTFGSVMSILAGLLQILNSFVELWQTHFLLRLIVLGVSIIGISYVKRVLAPKLKNTLRFVRAILIAALVLLFISVFEPNPWAWLEKGVARFGLKEQNSLARTLRTKRIETAFKPLRFSRLLRIGGDNVWCKEFPAPWEAASFQLWRSTPPPWPEMTVSFTVKVLSPDDWGLRGVEVFNLAHSANLKDPGKSVEGEPIRRKGIKLGRGALGFEVVVCGNPKREETKRLPLHESLDLIDIEIVETNKGGE